MAQEQTPPSGPDLTKGVGLDDFVDDKLLGHVGDEEVLLVRSGGDIFAVGAHCSHYHGPLAEGLVTGESVRCPWHHACFDLRTGEAERAPALSPIDCWTVEERDGRIFVTQKREQSKPRAMAAKADTPNKIVIVGGGAAGFAAAEMLRRRGYGGSIVMVSNDAAPPVDRPNLSKDYLAGSAPEDWLPLRPDDFYGDKQNRLAARHRGHRDRYASSAKSAAPMARASPTTGCCWRPAPSRCGCRFPAPICRTSIRCARSPIAAPSSPTRKSAKRVLVIGASFIGLEAAAALRARNIEVHVVAPETRPMERVLGPQLGDFIRALHEEHGVVFHLGETVTAFDGRRATLKGGGTLEADLVVVGVGVRPRLALAEQAGLTMDRGVVVDAYLRTSAPDIYAAGDIARWPDPHSGAAIRVEHWVVAERQGQTAARNMLGASERFDAVPFFWSQHYDVPINYVGHAEQWDEIAIDGSVEAKDCVLRYKSKGRVLAVASIYRDLDSLKAELAMEQGAVP